MTPDEAKSLADTEKQLAINTLNKLLGVPEGFVNTSVEFAVNKIINATLLYSAELQSRALNNEPKRST